MKRVVLLLSDNYLYLAKEDDCGVRRQMCVVLAGLELLDEMRCMALGAGGKVGFRLVRNSRALYAFTEDRVHFGQWQRALTARCFQKSFHEEYSVLKLIGQGTFAKVYLATKKDSGEAFAVKAFSKEYIK
jgi:hypothetical protein